ncbi:hypothetical protein [Streptomyces fulvoviolaceus]|uniref:hypothetical protein n=1 Tax=Streptomyces fulvoviolaceus TaxID=285535 RepID=UPI0004CB133A|nr:hypothetical protein [Streptomyces fulvoviolaceus]
MDIREPVYGTAADDLRDELADTGSGPIGLKKTAIWVGDGPEKHAAYAAWKIHLRTCEACSADCGCGTEQTLWAAYRAL